MTKDENLTLRDIALAATVRHGVKGGRALGRVAEKLDLDLSYTTVDKILAGKYTSQPGRDTLDALVALSGCTREEVYEAAGEPLPLAPFSEALPPDADLLEPDQRQAVIDVIRQLARSNRAVYEARRARTSESDARNAAPITQAGESPARDTITDDAETLEPRPEVDDQPREKPRRGKRQSG